MRPPGVYVGVTRAEYDADPGFNQSLIKDFLSAPTPHHFKYWHDNPEEPSPQARARMDIGNAVDLYISDRERYAEAVCTRPTHYPAPTKGDPEAVKEWSGNSTWCKKWLIDARARGQLVFSPADRCRVDKILLALEACEDARKLIAHCKKQVMVIAKHPKLGFRMKCLLDLMPDLATEPEWIFDNKTSELIEPVAFSQLCYDKGYNVQAAFYMDALHFLGHCSVSAFGFIVSESIPPHCVGIRFIKADSDEARAGREKYEKGMSALAECIEKNSWPDYGTQWQEVKFQPYMFRARATGDVMP